MIPVYKPFLSKNQKKYVQDCLDSNWISSRGKYVELFEQKLCEYLRVKHAVAVCNGTVSLHLLLAAADIGKEDEILVPHTTYIAPISAIYWSGASPVLLPVDNNYRCILDEKCITKNTKAILLPQLYGDTTNIDEVLDFCKKFNILLLEDSAEVFGCSYKNQKLGTFGSFGSFSFFSNKVITGGELGAVVTNDDNQAKKLRDLRNHNHSGYFIHKGPGFNFRATNIHCAIGLAQLEEVDSIISRKKEIADFYRKKLLYQAIVPENCDSSEWMPLFVLPKNTTFKEFDAFMKEKGIEIRPSFNSVKVPEMWNYFKNFCKDPLNISHIPEKGFNLPSHPGLSQEELEFITKTANLFLSL